MERNLELGRQYQRGAESLLTHVSFVFTFVIRSTLAKPSSGRRRFKNSVYLTEGVPSALRVLQSKPHNTVMSRTKVSGAALACWATYTNQEAKRRAVRKSKGHSNALALERAYISCCGLFSRVPPSSPFSSPSPSDHSLRV